MEETLGWGRSWVVCVVVLGLDRVVVMRKNDFGCHRSTCLTLWVNRTHEDTLQTLEEAEESWSQRKDEFVWSQVFIHSKLLLLLLTVSWRWRSHWQQLVWTERSHLCAAEDLHREQSVIGWLELQTRCWGRLLTHLRSSLITDRPVSHFLTCCLVEDWAELNHDDIRPLLLLLWSQVCNESWDTSGLSR